jgi:hypothetical protein
MKIFKLTKMLFVGSIILIMPFLGSVHAASFMMSFQVTGFPASLGNSAPTDPVIGSIVWEADDIHSPILSFDSIDLTLDGHSYSINEIGYISDLATSPPHDAIGGILNGTGIIDNQTDDFWITWDRNSLQPVDFMYTSSQESGFWYSSVYDPDTENFTAFSIMSVPEPSSISLASLILLGFCVRHVQCRRRSIQTPIGIGML